MELRRALLLFAIVLGLAAVVMTLSGPSATKPAKTAPSVTRTPTARPGPAAQRTLELVFDSAHAPVTHRLPVGRPATVTVRVQEPGTVDLRGLGLTAPAEPGTPARFDVLADREGRHAVTLTPPDGTQGRTVGTLVARPRH